MNCVDIFMYAYMCDLEYWLNLHSEEVLTISFQSDEANTDRPLKEYLKYVIESECNQIQRTRAGGMVEVYDSQNSGIKYQIDSIIMDAKIESVYLSEEISPELKDILKSRKKAVFKNPDLCLAININGKIAYESIELKSTKKDAIPGSSIQQVSPNEWVVFVRHTGKTVEFITGLYFHTINSKMQFPDRSPRPQVSFGELEKWNNSCRYDDGKTIIYKSVGDEALKYELLNDWQDVLANRWIKIVFAKSVNSKDPWFNNNLRKFVLAFLQRYDEMTEKEKEEYRRNLSDITK